MKMVSTSHDEQLFYYFIRKFFPNAVNRFNYCDDNGNIVEADIFIPELEVAIEYDGVYWHKKRYERDVLKTRILNDAGLYVIHIRESGLKELPAFKGIQLTHWTKSSKSGLYTTECIELIFHYLADLCREGKKADLLRDYSLSYEEFEKELLIFNSEIYDKKVENSFLEFTESKYWDYEKNGSLDPANVPFKANIKVFFKCPAGFSKFANVALICRESKYSKDDVPELNKICPFYNRPSACFARCKYFYRGMIPFLDNLMSSDIQLSKGEILNLYSIILESDLLLNFLIDACMGENAANALKFCTVQGVFLKPIYTTSVYISNRLGELKKRYPDIKVLYSSTLRKGINKELAKKLQQISIEYSETYCQAWKLIEQEREKESGPDDTLVALKKWIQYFELVVNRIDSEYLIRRYIFMIKKEIEALRIEE